MKRLFSYVAIPAGDFERAFNFYSVITGGRLVRNNHASFPMAYFTDAADNYWSHLFQLPGFTAYPDGVIVYMEISVAMDEALQEVENAEGKIVMPRTLIAPGKGYWALFLDSEGNRLATHSES